MDTKSGQRLQKAYQEAETKLADEDRRRRERQQEEANRNLKDIVKHPVVTGWIDSAKKLWTDVNKEPKHAASDRPTKSQNSGLLLVLVIALGAVCGIIFLSFILRLFGLGFW
jgi:hypothetical protein